MIVRRASDAAAIWREGLLMEAREGPRKYRIKQALREHNAAEKWDGLDTPHFSGIRHKASLEEPRVCPEPTVLRRWRRVRNHENARERDGERTEPAISTAAGRDDDRNHGREKPLSREEGQRVPFV